MIEGTVVKHRLDWQQLHDATVDVQMTAHLDRFDERRQRDRDPHDASERNLRRRMRAEILNQPEIGVVDDRRQRDRKLTDGEAAEPRALGAPLDVVARCALLAEVGRAARRVTRRGRLM